MAKIKHTVVCAAAIYGRMNEIVTSSNRHSPIGTALPLALVSTAIAD
jgi:hypothetical protein